ncbi:MAG: DUF2202 domain-containing protein [Crenarchaeota archaeon]|nr:DUF2202 domain-containing protein [Thermoproteota archaeon]
MSRYLWVAVGIIIAAIIAGTAAYYYAHNTSGKGVATAPAITRTTIATQVATTRVTSSSAASTVTSGAQLSPEEIEAIKYMAEEEKLALDVYTKLAQMYPSVKVFSNIAKSEQTHVNAVLSLARKYGISITLGPPGKFANPHLQELYNKLIEEGSKGLEQALKVGALIEETDIKDLQEWIAKVHHEDIKQVFECLMMGSRNHLRAFVSTLEKMFNTTYTPQVLSKQEFEKIISSPMETGPSNTCAKLGINVGSTGH